MLYRQMTFHETVLFTWHSVARQARRVVWMSQLTEQKKECLYTETDAD